MVKLLFTKVCTLAFAKTQKHIAGKVLSFIKVESTLSYKRKDSPIARTRARTVYWKPVLRKGDASHGCSYPGPPYQFDNPSYPLILAYERVNQLDLLAANGTFLSQPMVRKAMVVIEVQIREYPRFRLFPRFRNGRFRLLATSLLLLLRTLLNR